MASEVPARTADYRCKGILNRETKDLKRGMGMKIQITAIRKVFTRAYPLVLLAFGFCASMQSMAQSGVAPTLAPNRLITASIDEADLATLRGSTLPAIKGQTSEEVAPDDFKLDRMMLQLKRSAAQDAALKRLLNDQQNPKSPSYHRWLTPAQFGAQYSANAQDITAITNWLESHGFTIESVAKGRNIIQFSGTQAQLRSAFHTEMRGYTIRNAHHWANASDAQIPAALAPAIAGIVSLNDVPIHSNHTNPILLRKDAQTGKFVKAGQWMPATAGSAAGAFAPSPQYTIDRSGQVYHLVGPSDFAAIYNLQPLWNAGLDGAGQNIAITARSNINTADVDAFRAEFGLPAKKLNVILVTGVDPGLQRETGDESETALDVEWSGAVARSATIDLVVSPSTNTTDGTVTSEQYIIDENIAPVLSVSYGACEFDLQTSGNQFYNEMWEQAAAEGITVVVAAGDDGPSTCDAADTTIEPYEVTGLNVSGVASTPYDVAVGGTDFKTFATAPGEGWNDTNDPTSLASATGYIRESPWNNSCESPEILSYLNALGVSDPTNAALCQDQNETTYGNFQGGGGGQSNCIASTNPNQESSCTAGYPKPSWQSILPGTPSDNVRDLPDVSLFAANGAFNSVLPYCQSDALPPGYTCATDPEIAGGTSFAAPAFAGVMAIINQKVQSSQGLANYLLYKIAAQEYGNAGQLAACDASAVVPGNNCSFYDITEGNINVPCGQADCTFQGGGLDGIGWSAVPGYDMASGIGSVNIANLADAWSTAAANMLSSQTTLALPATSPYGVPLSAKISVVAAPPGTGTPTGTVLIQLDGAVFSAPADLSTGAVSLPLPAISAGAHQVIATYGGDANFDGSVSSASTLTVSKASTALALSATRTAAVEGQSVTLSAIIQVTTNGNEPTGTVSFTDTTSSTLLGTAEVSSGGGSNGQAVALATLTLPASALASGSNAIAAAYTGDANYAASSSTSSVNVAYSIPFSVAISPAQLQLSAANATGAITINVTPAAGTTLQPSSLNFGCAGTLAPGVSCSFSPSTLNASTGTISSTLTVQVNTSQISPAALPADHAKGRLELIAFSGLGGFMLIALIGKRDRLKLFTVLCIATAAFGIWGCSGGSNSKSAPSKAGPGATTTALTASSLTPAFGSAVTLQASVSSASAGSTPTGAVTFFDGSSALGTMNLASGSASFSSSSLSLGSHAITAKYSGDTGDASSISAAANVDVTYSTNLTVTVGNGSGSSVSQNLPVTVQ